MREHVTQASETPRTSAAHASAQIAEALQELQESGAAAAAQGNDGAPVAVAQAPISGAKAQGDKASPVVAKAAHGLPPASEIEDDFPLPDDDAQQPADAQAAAADGGQGNAGAKTGSALKAWTADELLGERVRVLANATGKKQKPWIDYEGTVTVKTGADSVIASIYRAPRCSPVIVEFKTDMLELITPEAQA